MELRYSKANEFIGWTALILGFFFSFTAIIIGIFRFFYKASVEFQVVISPRVLEKFEYEFDDECCTTDKIREVMHLDDGVLERLSHIDEDFLLQRHRMNEGIIRCIRKTKSASNELSGFYIIYPITEECEKLIEQGYLVGSRMIRPEHICKNFEEASAIYISAVYGRDMSTRGFVVYLLKRDLKDILRRNKNMKHIYSRPASSEGHLLVKKFKFFKMPTNPEMYQHKLGSLS